MEENNLGDLKVRVAHVDDLTMICLEDLIDFYSLQYAKLSHAAQNGYASELPNSDTGKILMFLTLLYEQFGEG